VYDFVFVAFPAPTVFEVCLTFGVAGGEDDPEELLEERRENVLDEEGAGDGDLD
jgi:hypothetical protein